MPLKFAALVLLLTVPLWAQQGDVRDAPGTVQKDPIPSDKIPPSPPLFPADALKSFKIQPGFHIDMIASEPLVHDPIALTFAPDGRVWVVEMSGYMPNVDGTGENTPVGKIIYLDDRQKNGIYSHRTVFLDHLVLPRAIALVRDGLLVAEPPHLWFYPIIDGSKPGKRTEIAKDLGNNYNPQGEANGLMRGLDNWIYSACYPIRFRNIDGEWQSGPTTRRGEWGISQDDFGRLIYNSNEDQFRIDLVPAEYLLRNPNYRSALGVNVDPIHDQTVWPVRMNPGVNRGYWKGILRPDGTLAKTTAACGPLIYRGDNFPPEYRGNAFVCEPAGNLIIRDILSETEGQFKGHKAYEHAEFLASTDERFRPTSLYNGPDGALYFTDMYRGVLEDRLSLTTYLRRQIKARNLESPLGLGRIYRVYYGDKPPKRETLADLDSAHLVEKLGSPRGWVQDTAQRLLVERDNESVVPALRTQALESSNPVTQIHSAWTLEGMDRLDLKTVVQLFDSNKPKVRSAAIRLSERFLRGSQAVELVPHLLAMAESDRTPEVQRQLAFTLGQSADAEAERALIALADYASSNPLAREAMVSSLFQRELTFCEALCHRWQKKQPGYAELLVSLAECLVNERNTNHIDRLLQLAAAADGWEQGAILSGLADRVSEARRRGRGRDAKPLFFSAEPAGLIALESNAALSEIVGKISPFIGWPGKPGYVPPPAVPQLTTEEQQRFDVGQGLFASTCAACHQIIGMGQPGIAPPLADSEWVVGPPERLARIVLQGAEGPISAAGVTFDSSMPSWAAFNDVQLASILTYIRRSWENAATPVTSAFIASLRARTAQRQTPWTAPELLAIP
ncbi:MAG TPA: c-type cytochrome [Verrucomicrobiae bacterium]|jgi:mono/diheme cytochrome c family protein/glucose/arabinose dehydrogenase